MEDKLCSVVRWHLKVFRLFCSCPISISANAKFARIQEKLWLIWGLFVAMLLNFLIFLYIKNHNYFLYHGDSFGFIVDCIQLIATYLTLQVSILEPLFMRRHQRTFWSKYIRLSSTRQLYSASFWTQIKEYKTFLLKTYWYHLMNIVLETIIIISMLNDFLTITLFLTTFLPYSYLLKFRLLQLIFCLDLIEVEIQNLDKDLQLLVEYTQFGAHRKTFPKFDEFIRLRIVDKQRTYEDIFEMVESFKNANGLSIIMNYVKCCVRLLVSSYWCCWAWYNFNLSAKDILLIPAILEIPMFLITAKNCMNAAKYISYRVHNLKHAPENIAASIQIQNFSLQLLHQKIKIDGLGISSMDGYMLTKAVGSITTYMVFFIQFMPKFKPKFD